MSETLLRVRDVLEQARVSRQVLNNYLMVGLLHEAQRTPAGHRLFTPDVVRRIRLIQQLNESGYTLREIREIFLKRRGA